MRLKRGGAIVALRRPVVGWGLLKRQYSISSSTSPLAAAAAALIHYYEMNNIRYRKERECTRQQQQQEEERRRRKNGRTGGTLILFFVCVNFCAAAVSIEVAHKCQRCPWLPMIDPLYLFATLSKVGCATSRGVRLCPLLTRRSRSRRRITQRTSTDTTLFFLFYNF
jgi:hypothetical protein